MAVSKRRSNIVGSIACVVFALLSLAFGVFMAMKVQRMESVGIRTDAIVAGITTGAKNSKFAIVSFTTVDDVQIETKSMFQMFVIRQEIGDEVTALYDPDDPESAMIDNGMWNWDQPVFGILAGFILLGLAVLILVSLPQRDSSG